MMSSNFPQTTSILEVQREVAEDDWFILNFGIEETDELFYSSFANGYYSSLEVQGLPLTEVNGTNYIVGYNIDQLADNLANNIYPITETLAITDETLSTDEFGFYTGTIIYSYEERYIFDSFTDDLEVDVIVTQMSNHYSDSGDRFILSEISNVVYDFDRLNITGEGYITYSFDVETLDSLGTTSNGDMHIVTLVSNASTNEIVSFNSTLIDDSIFVSNDNSTTPVQSDLIFYPNPVYSGSKLNIKSNSRGRIRGLQLYNIRGQKIGDFEYESEKITIPSNLSSGIYFIKARMADGTKSQLKKMLIIKE
ncbi:MAG: hypothetical protein B6226_04865 [Candidatus Cloacimonetes bacterium 4572_65]|nr:MAG: hypothetical protein B6226_04865 [Candidatus Cloacimonetes bacterium 4572_65]